MPTTGAAGIYGPLGVMLRVGGAVKIQSMSTSLTLPAAPPKIA